MSRPPRWWAWAVGVLAALLVAVVVLLVLAIARLSVPTGLLGGPGAGALVQAAPPGDVGSFP